MDEMNNQRALTLVGKKNYPTKKKLPKMKQNIMTHPCGVFESKFNSFVSLCVNTISTFRPCFAPLLN